MARVSRTRRMHMAKAVQETGTGLRAAGYGRLSLETPDTTSPERQRDVVETCVRNRNYAWDPVTDYHEDIDKSGFDTEVQRDGLERLKANLDRYDVIVVYRLDRLTRRLIEFAELLQLLAKHNVTLVSATESFDTSTPMGQAMVWIVMIFAQMESENIGVRMQQTHSHFVRNGRFRGGQRPFGWKKSNSYEAGGWYLRLDEEEAGLLREAVEAVLVGRSIRSICVEWNERGIKTARGNDWSQGTLSHLLRNEVLIGHGIFGETVIKDEQGNPIQVAEPLLDEPTWARLQQVLNARNKGAGLVRQPSLLAGIATCAFCGRTLRANSRSYICPSFNDAHADENGNTTRASTERDCPGVAIEKKILDPWVLTWVVTKINQSRTMAKKAAVAAEKAEKKREAEYRKLRRTISQKLDRLEEDRYDGMYDGFEERKRFKARREALIDEIVALDAQYAPSTHLADILAEPLTVDALLARDVLDLRRFLQGVIGKLEVRKGTRGSRRPASDRVDAELVAALRAGRPRSQSPRPSVEAS